MTDRQTIINAFIAQVGWSNASVAPLVGDASTRRYLRLRTENTAAILMDHPPDTGTVLPFLAIAEHLRDCGLSAPRIFAANPDQGLVLMEDLGDTLYGRWLAANPADEQRLYSAAVDVLYHLHQTPAPAGLQRYDPKMMADFISPAFDHYLKGTISENQKQAISAELETNLYDLAPETDCVILRDYHADNLLWLPDRTKVARVGLLDFQDALLGHHCYDLISLLQDARRDVSAECAAPIFARYAELSGQPVAKLTAAAAALGAQRNLRILGIFARLSVVHGKHRYLDLLPRVWSHMVDNLNHPALQRLRYEVLAAFPQPDPAHIKGLIAT